MNADQITADSNRAEPAVIRVLLVDDHPLIRQAVRSVLEHEKDISIIGEGGNGEEAVELAQRLQPDVIVMDVTMPKMNGINATRQIKNLHPKIAVLILTVHDDDQNIQDIMKAGATGYLLKSVFGKDLVQAIRTVASGDMVLSPVIGKQLVGQAARYPVKAVKLEAGEKLSTHELEVLKLAAMGLSNKDIATTLGLSVRTIKGHLADIFAKLQVNSRTEAVMTGLKSGFISIEDLQ